MRQLDSALLALLQARRGVVVRLLIWITAKNWGTGLPETIGLWNEVQDGTIEIDGEERLYYGAGGILEVEPVTYETGLSVRMQTLRLSMCSPEVQQAILGYDARLAPVQVHRMVFDPITMEAVGAPHLVFEGTIDAVRTTTSAIGESGSVDVTAASRMGDLTRSITLKQSDESQQRRSGDRFRRWADVSGKIKVWWGQRPRGERSNAGGTNTGTSAPVSGGSRGGDR